MNKELIKIRTRPDRVLELIAREYGYDLGVPIHTISDELIKTEAPVLRRGVPVVINNTPATASCQIKVSTFPGMDLEAYECSCFAPVAEDELRMRDNTFYFVEDFMPCPGRGGVEKFMILGQYAPPKWLVDGLGGKVLWES